MKWIFRKKNKDKVDSAATNLSKSLKSIHMSSSVPIIDGNNEVIGAVDISIDIVEPKKMEANLRIDKCASIEKNHDQAASLLPKLKIMLVEDNNIAAKSAKSILQSSGCCVDVANTGKAALELFEVGKYHLIYMDLGLPDISGIEVTKKIREIEKSSSKRTHIVALSAHVDASVRSSCLDYGMDDVIAKPLSRDQAIRIMITYVENNTLLINQVKSHVMEPSELYNAELKVIDLELGKSIINSDAEGAKNILKMFVDGLPEEQKELDDAYRSKRVDKLAIIVHKMHSGLCYCGAPRLKNAIKKLEKTLRIGELDKLEELYQNVCSEIDVFIHAFKQLV